MDIGQTRFRINIVNDKFENKMNTHYTDSDNLIPIDLDYAYDFLHL